MIGRAHLSRAQRREMARLKREFQLRFANVGMPTFLDRLFGRGEWSYDEREQLYLVPDRKDAGPGRAFYCIRPNGDWFKARLPAGDTQ